MSFWVLRINGEISSIPAGDIERPYVRPPETLEEFQTYAERETDAAVTRWRLIQYARNIDAQQRAMKSSTAYADKYSDAVRWLAEQHDNPSAALPANDYHALRIEVDCRQGCTPHAAALAIIKKVTSSGSTLAVEAERVALREQARAIAAELAIEL